MLFNSLAFLIFLPVVFILYWTIANRTVKLRNFFIVIASYFFYGWWDWRFLSLIAFSTCVDYIIGQSIVRSSKKKSKYLLLISLVVNLGLLGFFKYYNFFIDSFIDGFNNFGVQLNIRSLQILLPVGISFYTFQTLSYSIDVYRKKIKPTKDFIAFAAFVSFFPQLVAGPIERAKQLLPQFNLLSVFTYDNAVRASRLILWGFFKKVVVADNCATYVDYIYSNVDLMSGLDMFLGTVAFAFQIYGDFSGYSDIAIGIAMLFGFKLMTNFKTPYFSRDIAEFWRRWHISLSSWFRDYLYIPMGGSRKGKFASIRNVIIIFLVSGFWHGANWTFIIWGLINGLLFLPLLISNKNRKHTNIVAENKWLPSIKEFFSIGLTFIIVTLAWVFFRSENIEFAFKTFSKIFTFPEWGYTYKLSLKQLFPVIVLIIGDWVITRTEFFPILLQKKFKVIRITTYFIITYLIIIMGAFNNQEFIYFTF